MNEIQERAEAMWDAAHTVYEQIWTTDINKKQARRMAVSIITAELKAERDRTEKAEMDMASLCDAINTEARECGSLEADRPTRDEMRIAVQQIVDKLRAEIEKAEARVQELEDERKEGMDLRKEAEKEKGNGTDA